MKPFGERIALQGDGDVVAAWKSGMDAGRKLGLPVFKQACFSRAIMELARCAVEGGGGACTIEDFSNPQMLRAKVVFDAALPAAEKARGLLNGELRVAPSSPAVRLSQMVEWSAAPEAGNRTLVTLMMVHPRPAGRSGYRGGIVALLALLLTGSAASAPQLPAPPAAAAPRIESNLASPNAHLTRVLQPGDEAIYMINLDGLQGPDVLAPQSSDSAQGLSLIPVTKTFLEAGSGGAYTEVSPLRAGGTYGFHTNHHPDQHSQCR